MNAYAASLGCLLRARDVPPAMPYLLPVDLCGYVRSLDQMRGHVRGVIRRFNRQCGVPLTMESIRANARQTIEDYGATPQALFLFSRMWPEMRP